jgi:thiol:disulfide interchange protein DsbA
MKIMTKWLSALVLPFALSVAWAAADFVEGTHYTRLPTPQPTSVPDKIEVVELFSYACPHCFHLEPYLGKWLASKPDDVVFVRLPVVFRPEWEPLAKAYFTAELLGALDKVHPALFDAIHVKKQKILDEAAMREIFLSQSISAEDFSNTFNSFAVAVKVNNAKMMTRRYAITGVPALIVNGKYRAGGEDGNVLEVVDFLIAQERSAGKPIPTAAKTH